MLLRHLIIFEREFTIEELVEKSRQQTSQTVPTETGSLKFTRLEKNEFSAYNEYYIRWLEPCRNSYEANCNGVGGRVIRPNIECTNG